MPELHFGTVCGFCTEGDLTMCIRDSSIDRVLPAQMTLPAVFLQWCKFSSLSMENSYKQSSSLLHVKLATIGSAAVNIKACLP